MHDCTSDGKFLLLRIFSIPLCVLFVRIVFSMSYWYYYIFRVISLYFFFKFLDGPVVAWLTCSYDLRLESKKITLIPPELAIFSSGHDTRTCLIARSFTFRQSHCGAFGLAIVKVVKEWQLSNGT